MNCKLVEIVEVIVPFQHPYLDDNSRSILEEKEITIDTLWERIASKEEEFAKDACGAWIKKSEFRKKNEFGWDIDIIKPLSQKGKLKLDNLRAMHWKNILKKGEDYPIYQSAVIANGNGNIEFEKFYKINRWLQNLLK